MAGRQQRDRRAPARYTDYEALQRIQDSDEDISDFEDESTSDESSDSDSDDREPVQVGLHLPQPVPLHGPIPAHVPPFDPIPAPPIDPAPAPDDLVQYPLPYWNEIPWARLKHGPLLVDQSLPYQWEDFRNTDNVFAFITKEGHDPGFHMEELFGSLYHNPTELECFEAIFTEELRLFLLNEINNFVDSRIQKNTPARRRSRFRYDNWTPVNQAELYKFIAVVTAMGIDKNIFIICDSETLTSQRY